MKDSGDIYDYRQDAPKYQQHFREKPEIVAVYDILVAFNRNRHEGLPLSGVAETYRRESPKLGKYLRPDLRRLTEAALEKTELDTAEYNLLMRDWSILRGYLEDGRTIGPYIIIACIVVAAFVIIVFFRHKTSY